MCHLILGLPLLALPLFWLLPLNAALSLYGAVLALTVVVYVPVLMAWRLPVGTGRDALMHATGQVRQVSGRQATVWLKSELWTAEMEGGEVHVGDAVRVVGMDGLRLRIRPAVSPTRIREESCH
ncbi:MAG TPA: NfeD family protein [Pelomicrobium sp.]|nr:NfeD family protein [Pelomicrobium sp.]